MATPLKTGQSERIAGLPRKGENSDNPKNFALMLIL